MGALMDNQAKHDFIANYRQQLLIVLGQRHYAKRLLDKDIITKAHRIYRYIQKVLPDETGGLVVLLLVYLADCIIFNLIDDMPDDEIKSMVN
jgi:hypothetical protein